MAADDEAVFRVSSHPAAAKRSPAQVPAAIKQGRFVNVRKSFIGWHLRKQATAVVDPPRELTSIENAPPFVKAENPQTDDNRPWSNGAAAKAGLAVVDRDRPARYAEAMFTGIVQHVGGVASLKSTEAGAAIEIDPSGWSHHANTGESIAVNGCCLTLAAVRPNGLFGFDVIHETLRVTTLGDLKTGQPVNLEHAATPQTLLSGHIVQGHVDGIGLARQLEVTVAGEVRLHITPPPDLMEAIVPRGSIAVDGVSLTLADVGPNWFEVALIPTTLRRTTLDRIHDHPVAVNLETDCLVKAVVHYLKMQQ